MKQQHRMSPSFSLDIDTLKSVIAISDTGSLSSAAELVGRTPSALSMQLKKLEEQLGRSLFQRARQGMTATPDGEKLMGYARRILALNREAVEAFQGPILTGEISVGLIDDLGYDQLASVLGGFAKSHPEVKVTVVMAPSASLAPDFDRGLLDLVMLTPGCAVGRRDSDITLHTEKLFWMGAEDGCARFQDPLPVAVANAGCAWRRQTVEALDKSGRPYRIAYVSDFDAALQAAIHADLAVAALPRGRMQPGLSELPPSAGLPAPGYNEVVLRMGPEPTPVASALAEHMRQSYLIMRG